LIAGVERRPRGELAFRIAKVSARVTSIDQKWSSCSRPGGTTCVAWHYFVGMKHHHAAVGCVALTWAVVTRGAPYSIPIINPGFEEISRPMNVGEITNGSGGVGVLVNTRAGFTAPPSSANQVWVAGWRTNLPPPSNPGGTVYAGAMHPPVLAQGAYITGYTGTHIATLQVSPMQQTLDHMVQPNTRYRLRFKCGIGRFDSDYAAFVGLIAVPDREGLYFRGNPATTTLVGTSGVVFEAPGNNVGVMRTEEIIYTSPGVLPMGLAGRYIAVALNGSDGFPRMNYDDIELLATPVRCAGDLTGDGLIDTADLVEFLGAFGTAVPTGSPSDIEPDGVVNTADLVRFLGVFGGQC
jgi:hypothetical protein